MQQVGSYKSAEDSGLVSVQPYPQPNGVCQILGESPATVDYLDHSAISIGCPDHDLGAIEDRKTEGAKIVGKLIAGRFFKSQNSKTNQILRTVILES
jgi:hypothetical protein